MLKHLSETLGECPGSLSYNLTGEDIADGVHDHCGLFVAIVSLQLREVLKAEADGYLIASCSGDKIVETLENIWSAIRQL